MRRLKSPKNASVDAHTRSRWKRRPSEINGYHRTLYLNTDNGDYIRVDYNLNDKRVRLYIEDHEEGGNPYYAVISNGKVTIERNASTGRTYNLSEKFKKRAAVFSTVTNKQVLKLINKNYGIQESFDEIEKKNLEKKQKLERTRQRYFRSEDNLGQEQKENIKSDRKINFLDFVDFLVGVLICFAIYYFEGGLIYIGIASASFGILTGLFDIIFREREPLIIKMLVFIFAGLAFYVYGYYFF